MASFSPDASEIVFKEETAQGTDLLVVFNLEKRTRRVLLSMPYLDGPRWSPDGRTVVFAGRLKKSGGYSLYRCGLDGKSLSVIVNGEFKGGEMLFAWAPDSKSVVYQDAGNGIHILNLTNLKRTRVDSGWFPTWSPNGRYLAYRADGPDDSGYVLYDTQTGNKERILRGKYVYRSLIWSPENRYLIYAADGRGEFMAIYLFSTLHPRRKNWCSVVNRAPSRQTGE
jgi:Tol biopolymer transport system component